MNEFLYFDFDSTLNIGDNFESTYYNGSLWETSPLQITGIDSILINSSYYKSWEINYAFDITERIIGAKRPPFHIITLVLLGAFDIESKCYFENIQSVYGPNYPFSYSDFQLTIDIFDKELNFEMYPNPFTETIQINYAQNNQLLIYNSLGKLILSQSISSNQFNLDVSHLTKGLYLFKIGKTSKRLIKL